MSRAKKKRAIADASGGPAAVEEALRRFRPLLDPRGFELLLDELQHPLPQAFRVNSLKNPHPAQAVERWASLYGWQLQPVPYCAAGRQVVAAETPLSQTIEHRMGFYYIQDAASMLPVSLFEMDSIDRPLILDMAASPGGKTTHLTDRSRDRGFVLANDPGRDRITMLRIVLQNWGALNTAVTRFPGEKFGVWYPDTFDRVLLDAPCSMQNLRSTEARPMHTISAREMHALSLRQQNLLWSALQAVKPGGQVVYSTCSLDPEEDEMVLDAVLKRAGGAVDVVSAGDLFPPQAAGLRSANLDGVVSTFDERIVNAVRLWPHVLHTSGFFAALLTKTRPMAFEREDAPRAANMTGLRPLKPRDARELSGRLLDAYGFDFDAELQTHDLRLWERQGVVYAISEAWWRHFNRFPFQSVGMRIAETESSLTPSHEWVACFGAQFQRGIFRLAEDQIPAWLRGEDLPLSGADLPHDGVVAVLDGLGRLYGRGRVTSSRLRNLLPNRLVG